MPDRFWDTLKENIHVYVAGEYVHQLLLKNYNYESDVLNFGIPDYGKERFNKASYAVFPPSEKTTFLISSATYQYIKGHDIAALAIRISSKNRISLCWECECKKYKVP
ncbi:hypothetical protein LQZ18_15325 [Lachnospiraceae bacterium ZAX-1]